MEKAPISVMIFINSGCFKKSTTFNSDFLIQGYFIMHVKACSLCNRSYRLPRDGDICHILVDFTHNL